MKWKIPAKTFLLGEYAAIAGEAAILLTTTPCFELELVDEKHTTDIHPQSPAGLFWQQQGINNKGLLWTDPYQGKGGLGASSAQFIACYLACCHLNQRKPDMNIMLENYYHYAWNGQGLKPSGYDVIAQSQYGCVYLDQNKKQNDILPWRFQDLGFLLLHTGKKLATHHHLQKSTLPQDIKPLATISQAAKAAFIQEDSHQLIQAINQYHQQLLAMELVAEHSLTLIKQLKKDKRIKAIKGCGAMGADVILILSPANEIDSLTTELKSQGFDLLASHKNLFNHPNQPNNSAPI